MNKEILCYLMLHEYLLLNVECVECVICLMYDEYCVYESGKNVDGDSSNAMTCWQVKPFCSMMLYSIIELS